MTTIVGRSGAICLAIATAATLIAGCSGDSGGDSKDSATATPTSAATSDSSGTGSTGTGKAKWDPKDDICAIQDTWEKISPKIDAKAYKDAMLLTQSVFPPESIKEDWAQYRALLEDYVAVLDSGDQAKIDYAYPDSIRITEVRIRYGTAFLQLCT